MTIASGPAGPLTERDWCKAYYAARGRVARAGGAWTPEAWLVYAASRDFPRRPPIGRFTANWPHLDNCAPTTIERHRR